MKEYKCICKNPLTSEERSKFEQILSDNKPKKLGKLIWKLPVGEAIRFLHYLVQQTDKMRAINRLLGDYNVERDSLCLE